jgi:hypothetical protein
LNRKIGIGYSALLAKVLSNSGLALRFGWVGFLAFGKRVRDGICGHEREGFCVRESLWVGYVLLNFCQQNSVLYKVYLKIGKI